MLNLDSIDFCREIKRYKVFLSDNLEMRGSTVLY